MQYIFLNQVAAEAGKDQVHLNLSDRNLWKDYFYFGFVNIDLVRFLKNSTVKIREWLYFI